MTNSVVEQVTRAICNDTHLRCTFPDCGCVGTKPRAKAAMNVIADWLEGEAGFFVDEGIVMRLRELK